MKNIINKIRNFAIQKWKLLILSLAMFLFGFLVAHLSTSSYQSILKKELSRYKEGSWVVKIDGMEIGDTYIDRRTELFKKYIAPGDTESDAIIKDKMVKKLIDNMLVLKAAEKSGIFTGAKGSDYLWMFMEEAMVHYYLDFITGIKSKARSAMTDDEIDQFYKKNRPLFDKKNMKKEDAARAIKAQLALIEEDNNIKNKINSRKIEIGRLKKNSKIEYNYEKK